MKIFYPHFLIIGAQKSGTTSLFEILRSHYQIYMPPEKELQFFNRDEFFNMGLNEYAKRFSPAKHIQFIGEASPQYMASRKAAIRINTLCNRSKLIVILRNPIERAYSHYMMTLRRGRTTMTFEEAIKARMRSPYGCPDEPNLDHDYLLLGEYARMLTWYQPFFERNTVKVLLFDDLKNDPKSICSALSQFLNIAESGFQKTYAHAHKGGRMRFPKLNYIIRNSTFIKFIARLFLTQSQRNAILFWFDTRFNIKSQPSSINHSNISLIDDLMEYFRPDIENLEQLLGYNLPWLKCD